MKWIWIIILALSANSGAFAQGQVNFDTHVVTDNPPVDARVLSPGGTPLIDGFGELVILGNNGSLTPLTPIGAFGTGDEAGYIHAGTATAPLGYPGGTTVTMFFRAWLGSAGTTFDTSTLKGATTPITVTLTEAPLQPNDLIGLNSLGLLPEPGTLILGALGVGLMLLRIRGRLRVPGTSRR